MLVFEFRTQTNICVFYKQNICSVPNNICKKKQNKPPLIRVNRFNALGVCGSKCKGLRTKLKFSESNLLGLKVFKSWLLSKERSQKKWKSLHCTDLRQSYDSTMKTRLKSGL